MTKKSLQDKAFEALKEAVLGVIKDHKRTGRPLAIWRDGKVALISADEALSSWPKSKQSL